MRAAISVIAEKGTAALRMSDIAARAGMSTGHILYHFGKKDRLLLEVLAWSQSDLWTRFQQAADQAASPTEKLRTMAQLITRHSLRSPTPAWTVHGQPVHDLRTAPPPALSDRRQTRPSLRATIDDPAPTPPVRELMRIPPHLSDTTTADVLALQCEQTRPLERGSLHAATPCR
ncbi:TetR/AcrR family transcriptional regulator [Streptomyces xanthii]|uniref:TetR/AcrR family transcriptional regulator n=1 Tax=Streptomyces xanthii TaxID=2768069 RepID=UPI001CB79DE8|nr:TetR/AcrR family transcriptional regulator [Streptomyces xanthii]